MTWLNAFTSFLSDLTITEGVLLILVILFHRESIRSRDKELVARQHEINRLAEENHEYRDRFTRILDIESNLKYKTNN